MATTPRRRWQSVLAEEGQMQGRRIFSAPITRAGLVLGVGVGGFFDGILLHQILQWHHLLSGLSEPGLHGQIVADGLFHLLMFVLAGAGVVLLWRARHGGTNMALIGAVLAGFGLWHILDAVLSHWLIGLHRIRDGAANPLAWDIAWLLVFGLLPLALGWRLLADRRALPGATVPVLLAATLAAAAAYALAPRGGGDMPVIVLVAPGSDVAMAADAVNAALLESDPTGRVWAMMVPEGQSPWKMLRHGALPLGQGAGSGCLAWTRLRSA